MNIGKNPQLLGANRDKLVGFMQSLRGQNAPGQAPAAAVPTAQSLPLAPDVPAGAAAEAAVAGEAVQPHIAQVPVNIAVPGEAIAAAMPPQQPIMVHVQPQVTLQPGVAAQPQVQVRIADSQIAVPDHGAAAAVSVPAQGGSQQKIGDKLLARFGMSVGTPGRAPAVRVPQAIAEPAAQVEAAGPKLKLGDRLLAARGLSLPNITGRAAAAGEAAKGAEGIKAGIGQLAQFLTRVPK